LVKNSLPENANPALIRTPFSGQKMRPRVVAVSLLTILSALAQSAYSDFTIGTIDVDFNGSVSPSASALDAGVIGSTGDAWNVVASAPSLPQSLNFTTGAASGVTLQLTGSFSTGTSGGANGPNSTLTQDFLAVTGATANTGTVTLAGLTGGQQYSLYLYNGSTSIGRITDFSVTGGANGSVNNIGTPGAVLWTPATAIIPGNYVQLNGTATGGGQLVIQFMNRAASEGDFAGFQIRAIPEPSTYALLVTGAAALLIVAYRARRRTCAK
jgi:hypothetical protein